MQTWKSANLPLEMRGHVRRVIAIILLASAAPAGAATSSTDWDGDGAANSADNCINVANPGQLDADHDGYGNACDADLNNSGMITTVDLSIVKSLLNKTAESSFQAAIADLDGSGVVTSADVVRVQAMLNTPPGPSGTVAASGTATVSWLPPLQRTDGSALTNLAGYRIVFGTSPSALNQTIEIRTPGLATYTVAGLAPATWYFGLVAFDSAGTTSTLSAIGSKKIT